MAELVTTPHEREQEQIAAALADGGWARAADRAKMLQSLRGVGSGGNVLALAAVLSLGQLEALHIALKRAPRPKYRRTLAVGHHRRAECVERPGEWCQGIGGHPGRCDSCPTRADQLMAVERATAASAELRRKWDRAMWGEERGE